MIHPLLCNVKPNFYPRSPCGERPLLSSFIIIDVKFLSTLSLRRATPATGRNDQNNIFLSTLSLRRATFINSNCNFTQKFLSTLSLRRATTVPGGGHISQTHFYPRSPCGERPAIDVFLAVWAVISIHALLAESDANIYETVNRNRISIHALLAESDHETYVVMEATKIISIHALLAESDVVDTLILANAMLFLSTLSLRRATMILMLRFFA